MRGLTNEEREALIDPPDSPPMSDDCCRALTARGLILDGPCAGCGVPAGAECLEFCESDLVETVLTPLGSLAIRLDTAARAIGGSRG